MLRAKPAQIIALALNELATNAIKYGAFSMPDGNVKVTWNVERGPQAERRLVLKWIEQGVLSPSQAVRRGFGTELIEKGVPYTVGGTSRMDFGQDGLRCTFEIPLSDTVSTGLQNELRDASSKG